MAQKNVINGKISFAARVNEKIAGKTRGMAKSTGMTISEIVEKALTGFIKDFENETGKRLRSTGPRVMKKAA